MSQPSKASPRDMAEMYISLNQVDALKTLLEERPELTLQRRRGRMLEHLCQEKPALLAVIQEAKARLEAKAP